MKPTINKEEFYTRVLDDIEAWFKTHKSLSFRDYGNILIKIECEKLSKLQESQDAQELSGEYGVTE